MVLITVKFLKVLSNSLLSAVYLAWLLALLVLTVNINSRADLSELILLVMSLAVVYGPPILIFCAVAFFSLQFFSGRHFRIRFVSPSFLAVSFSVITFLFLFVFRQNIKYFEAFFDGRTRPLIVFQAVLLLVWAILAPAAFFLFHRTGKKPLVFIAAFILFAGVVFGVAKARMGFPEIMESSTSASIPARKIEKNIHVLGFEGMSFDFLIPLMSEGKLPNFSWLAENGAWGKLEGFSPNESFVLNTSFNTGKLPSKHRQLSLFDYSLTWSPLKFDVVPRFMFIRQLSRIGYLQTARREPAPVVTDIWRILEDNGSAYLRRDRQAGECPAPTERAEKGFDHFLQDEAAAGSYFHDQARKAFFCDWDYEEKAFADRAQTQPTLSHILLGGLNTVQSIFYKYSFPDLFGNIPQEDINRHGSMIERYYAFCDQIVGKYLASLKDEEILVVYSPFGVEPLPLWKRFVEGLQGNSEISAHHEDAPEGVVFFYGKGIRKGRTVEGMKIVDIAPTLLYCFGLPVGKDMDGIVISEIFLRDYTAENPVFYISSYEEIAVSPAR
jgi:hypothetical protein